MQTGSTCDWKLAQCVRIVREMNQMDRVAPVAGPTWRKSKIDHYAQQEVEKKP